MAQKLSKFWRAVLLFGKGMEKQEKACAISALTQNLQQFFETRGFAYAKAYQAFRKSDGDLRLSFALNLFVHADSFTISPQASIRHEMIERIFHRVSEAPETVQRDSGTVLWTWALEGLRRQPPSFTVDRSSRVTAGVEFSTRFFCDWCEPFFKRHSTLEAISGSFNNGCVVLRAKHFADWFDLLGRALIAAKLAKRADYDVLKMEYRKALEIRQSAPRLSAFDALVQILEKEF